MPILTPNAVHVVPGRAMARYVFLWGNAGIANLGKNDCACKNYKKISHL